MQYPSPLEATLKGVLAGTISTGVITAGLKATPEVIAAFGVAPRKSLPTERHREEPTMQLAQKLAKGVFDTRLDKDSRIVAGQALHWSYGVGWGALYGIIQGTLQWPPLLAGTLFGGLVAAAAAVVVPAMGLSSSPPPKGQVAAQFGYCMVFGWITALAFDRLSPRRNK